MATNTETLELFKYDSATDANNNFNVKQGLNDNWDKIDTNAKSINTKFDNINKDYVRMPGVGVATASGNNYSISTNPAPTAYIDNIGIIIRAQSTSTGATTLNWNGLGAKTLKNSSGENVQLKQNAIYFFRYNTATGTFIMVNEIPTKTSQLTNDSGYITADDIPTSMPANGGNAETAQRLKTPRTISLTGDATGSTPFDGSANKSIIVVLANSGAAAGTYTKLTIDAKGRVTSATNLSASDIPNLDWSKIASGKPTTLAGYGVTDAVSKYIILPSGTDLNTVVTSGFYRLDATSPNYTNLPPNSNVSYGQLIVSRGVDTVFQILTGYNNNEYYMRQGAKGGGTDTNFTGWQPWRKIWHDGNFNPDTKTKRVVLTGQLQTNSYVKSVIALCELTNTDINFNSYSSGIISFHRGNGTTGAEINSLYVGAEKKANTTNMNYFGLGLGNNIINLRPCTFTYNGIKYGGLEFKFTDPESSIIEFNGSSNFDIFGLDYYNTSTSTVLNQEVHDSLEFDTTIYKGPNLVYNNEKVITHEEQGGINLLSNGDFSRGFHFWSTNNAATQSVILDEKFGHCCKVVTSTNNAGIYNFTPMYIKNIEGTYVYSAWLKSEAPMTISFGLNNNRQTITVTTEWVRYYFILNKSSSWNNVFTVYNGETTGNEKTFYVANAQVETGTMITDWKPSVEDIKSYSDNKILSLGTTTNSGNAYTLTAPTGFTLQDGQLIVMKFNAASSGAITINVGGTGAKSVKDYFGNSITNVRANLPANLVYESSSDSFILLGKGGGGNAVAGDLLSGKTATVDAGQITGTIPLKSAQTYTPGTSNQTIASKQYLDGVQTILGDAALISANIKANASIFNVAGKSTVVDTEDATGVAADVRAGKTVYIKGNKVIGTKPVQATAAQTITPGTSDIIKPAGIYDDTITIKGDANLKPENIREDVSMFGKIGTLKPYELTAGDSNVLFLDSQEYNTTSYTRIKVGKTITTNIKGKIRISFDLRCGGSASLAYEVDKNGSLVTSNSYNSTSWTTKTIDVTCSQGDIFEFLIMSYNEDYNAYIKNIKVSTDLVSPLTIA